MKTVPVYGRGADAPNMLVAVVPKGEQHGHITYNQFLALDEAVSKIGGLEVRPIKSFDDYYLGDPNDLPPE